MSLTKEVTKKRSRDDTEHSKTKKVKVNRDNSKDFKHSKDTIAYKGSKGARAGKDSRQGKEEKEVEDTAKGLNPNFNKNSNPSSSKESHQKQKVLVQERKAAKPNAESIQRAKQLWERLRRKSHVEKNERKELVAELFSIVTGNVHPYVFKHDSVRVIQCALKYANEEQRTIIATELKGEFRELTKSKYGKFLVAKLLTTGNEEVKEMILSEWYGHVRPLINNAESSWVLDDTYRSVASPKQKASMLREWYGPEFAIFKSKDVEAYPTADLNTILAESPEKRKPILHHLKEMISQLVQKKMVAFTMLHDAMLQYSLAVGSPGSSEAAVEFYDLLKDDEEGELIKNLGFTHPGARLVCRMLAFSNAKARKQIMKEFREHIRTLSFDVNGRNVLITAFEVIDDTKLVSQNILNDLLGVKLATEEERYNNMVQMVLDPISRVALLYPFTIGRPKWLIAEGSDTAKIIEEVRNLRTETSKKEPETRRMELVKSLSEGGIILKSIENRAEELIKNALGCQFITEFILGCEGDKTGALTAIVKLVGQNPESEGHIAKSSFVGRMLKTLAMGEKFDALQKIGNGGEGRPAGPRLGFAELLYNKIKGNLLQWALSPNSFLVSNYLEDEGFKEKGDIIKRLRKSIPQLQEASANGNKGASFILSRF